MVRVHWKDVVTGVVECPEAEARLSATAFAALGRKRGTVTGNVEFNFNIPNQCNDYRGIQRHVLTMDGAGSPMR